MAIITVNTVIYLGGFILIVCAAIYAFLKNAYSYWEKLGVPFIPPSFIYGSTKDSTTMKISLVEELNMFYKQSKDKGLKYVGVYLFHRPFFIPIDINLVKNILAKDFDHFVDRGMYHDEENDPLSAHLFSLEGMRWRQLRQKLTPTFTSGKMKRMFQTIVDCTEDLKNCLNEPASKCEPINIKNSLVKYTTDVIGSVAFGIDCNSFKNPDSDFIKNGEKIFLPSFSDRLKLLASILFPTFMKWAKIQVTNKDVDIFFRRLVKDTIEYREKNNIVRNDFLQLLIQLKNKGVLDEDELGGITSSTETKLTMNEVSAQAFLFFVGGFESSSTTMTFCLYELSKNQEIQERTRKEIIRVLKKHDGKITYDALMEMQYTERVVQETLRKHPPFGILQRCVTQDYQIPDTDVVLKKGLSIFIPAFGLQNDPEFYPEPEKFDPDRFTEEGKSSRPDYTYMPFGEGPRVCIALRFGMMQSKLGVVQLLLNYKFTLNPKTIDPLKYDPATFIMSVEGDVWLNAEKICS